MINILGETLDDKQVDELLQFLTATLDGSITDLPQCLPKETAEYLLTRSRYGKILMIQTICTNTLKALASDIREEPNGL